MCVVGSNGISRCQFCARVHYHTLNSPHGGNQRAESLSGTRGLSPTRPRSHHHEVSTFHPAQHLRADALQPEPVCHRLRLRMKSLRAHKSVYPGDRGSMALNAAQR